MESDIRRWRSNLAISGLAYIGLGIWNSLKTLLFYFSNRDDFEHALIFNLFDASEDFGYRTMLATLVVALLFNLLFHCYVGFSALAEAQGRRRGKVYLLIAIFQVVMSLVTMVSFIAGNQDSNPIDSFIPGIIELTSTFAVFDVAISSIRLRRLQRRVESQG